MQSPDEVKNTVQEVRRLIAEASTMLTEASRKLSEVVEHPAMELATDSPPPGWENLRKPAELVNMLDEHIGGVQYVDDALVAYEAVIAVHQKAPKQ